MVIPTSVWTRFETFPIGMQVGSGQYRCVCCGVYVAQLRGPEDQLPPCENCGSHVQVRYIPDDDEARWS